MKEHIASFRCILGFGANVCQSCLSVLNGPVHDNKQQYVTLYFNLVLLDKKPKIQIGVKFRQNSNPL